jgi:WD40 repeat protein
MFSPDGKTLAATGYRTGEVQLWDVKTGDELLRLKIGEADGRPQFSPDGKLLAVPHQQGVSIWEWQNAAEPRTISTPPRGSNSASFSPDGRTLVTMGDDQEGLRFWDVSSGKRIRTITLGGNWDIGQVQFAPDGKTLAMSSSRTKSVSLYDPNTGQLIRKLADSPAVWRSSYITFSRNSRQMAASVGQGVLQVFDVATGLAAFNDAASHTASVNRIAAGSNGLIVTASDDQTVRVWDVTTGEQRSLVGHGHWVRGLAMSPDGKRAASSGLDDVLSVWDLTTGKSVYKLFGHGKVGGRRAVAFTPDGARLASWGDDMQLRVWDMKTGKALAEHLLRPEGVKVPDPNSDSDLSREMRMMIMGEGAFSADGQRFVLDAQGHLHVFDVSTGKASRKIARDGSRVIGLTVSPDGRWLAASELGKPKQIKLADGRTLHTSADNHTVTLWELDTGRTVQQIMLPQGGAGPVAFSTDNNYLAIGANEAKTRIRFIEVATGKEVGTFDDLPSGLRALAFTPDGSRLISGMNDTTVLVWDIRGRLGK